MDDAKWLRALADDCESGIEPSRKQCERLRRVADRIDAAVETMVEISADQQQMIATVSGMRDRLQAKAPDR